jgi:hypothetical protein
MNGGYGLENSCADDLLAKGAKGRKDAKAIKYSLA